MGSETMEASEAQLTRWERSLENVLMAIQRARMLLTTKRAMADGKTTEEHLFGAQEETQRLYSDVRRTCARHGLVADDTRRRKDELSLLASLGSAEARELLETLERAQMLAEVVDAQRGLVLPAPVAERLLPGEARGLDYAETISHMTRRLRTEIHGPAGRE